MEALKAGWALFLKHRKRLAPFVLTVAVLVVGGELYAATPRATEIRYRLGQRHEAVSEATIVYLQGAEEMKGVRFSWERGAPETVSHSVELMPGRYEIRVELVVERERRVIRRGLSVPADGVVRVDLREEPADGRSARNNDNDAAGPWAPPARGG